MDLIRSKKGSCCCICDSSVAVAIAILNKLTSPLLCVAFPFFLPLDYISGFYGCYAFANTSQFIRNRYLNFQPVKPVLEVATVAEMLKTQFNPPRAK